MVIPLALFCPHARIFRRRPLPFLFPNFSHYASQARRPDKNIFTLPTVFLIFHLFFLPTAKMKFTLASVLALVAVVSAATVETPEQGVERREVRLMERQGANANRPVPNGACCVANTSLKQDVCRVNGQNGRCVPAGVNNCGTRLTCIEDNRLTCNAAVLERGRPLCRLRQ
ncbi:hypothetical protein GGTG_06404 [Gaeumannomyces tritici R3-111a-1]|uniref:Uncharacterized protein n=1 Tax=Gaeumannomyces tritici (strain R3-111a-1) TaxID=644352 RepID=J3NYQ2_GAET3|nr:hypothetical protein GGTG_06404 [Gaeumannomyces tritici R3-111a-1]EJT76485.1 hypothetical protein GGTG_06404 [Gaeumannomyces tritici R3-111a-1]